MTTKLEGAILAQDFFEKELGPMTFGTFLTAARISLCLSQVELAKKLKVSRSMVCDIEKGRVMVSVTLAAKIARIGGFPELLAVKYCLQDQLRKAKVALELELKAA